MKTSPLQQPLQEFSPLDQLRELQKLHPSHAKAILASGQEIPTRLAPRTGHTSDGIVTNTLVQYAIARLVADFRVSQESYQKVAKIKTIDAVLMGTDKDKRDLREFLRMAVDKEWAEDVHSALISIMHGKPSIQQRIEGWATNFQGLATFEDVHNATQTYIKARDGLLAIL